MSPIGGSNNNYIPSQNPTHGILKNVLQGAESGMKAGEIKGMLGLFSVQTSESSKPNDIAKAAAMTYHMDLGDIEHFVSNRKIIQRKKIRSKFAKRGIDDDADDGVTDHEVDEATREEEAKNDSKYSKLLNAHIARLARERADTY